MTILDTIETSGREALSAVDHAAAWLVGHVAQAATDLRTLEASDPIVGQAIAAGEAFALAHGVPVPAIEAAGEAVLAAAKGFAVALGQTGAALPPTKAVTAP
jgi:hypothetical protein